MIVRILEEGQYRLDEATIAVVEALDVELEKAISENNSERFGSILDQMIEKIHDLGEPLDELEIVPSDLALPPSGTTIEEVAALLSSEQQED